MSTDAAPTPPQSFPQVRLSIPPDLARLEEVYRALDRFETAALARDAQAVALVYAAFKTAVVEIITNILRHAYPPGHPVAPVRIHLVWADDWVAGRPIPSLLAHVEDHGIAFTLPSAASPPDLDDVAHLVEGGMGLFLAQRALNALACTRAPEGVNHWRLVKHLPVAAG